VFPAVAHSAGPKRASPVPAVTFHTFHALYAGEFLGAAFQALHPFRGLRPEGRGSALPLSHPKVGTFTARQASLHAADRMVAPPYGALDAGLRPDPFPDRAASLLPGSLTITRTGLPPAGDDEHTKQVLRHDIRFPPWFQGALPDRVEKEKAYSSGDLTRSWASGLGSGGVRRWQGSPRRRAATSRSSRSARWTWTLRSAVLHSALLEPDFCELFS
jgi:hypothetical protein